jgi:glutamate dehydrogenase/leucine dehydrogenase
VTPVWQHSALVARSSALCAREAAKALGIELRAAAYAVNGFGVTGSAVAAYMAAYGSKMIACDDFVGGAYNPKGMDPLDVARWKLKHGTVRGFPGSVDVRTSDLYALPVDIVVAAGLPNAVTEEMSSLVKARVIVEAVEGAVMAAVDGILHRGGVMVVPDLLSLAGASLNLCRTAEEVDAGLEKMMVDSFAAAFARHAESKVSIREAARLVEQRPTIQAR